MTSAALEPSSAPHHAWHLGPVASVTPEDVGWSYCGLRIVTLGAGETATWATGDAEQVILPLRGGVEVRVDDRRFELEGRESVFTRVTDWAYLPIDADVRVRSADGAEIAVPSARAERRFDAVHVAAADVPVEVRGAGPATRQVTNFMAPDVFPHADRLMCVELLTPDGNWSSYPPHKHDDSPECPVNNEELYYFRIGRAGTGDVDSTGFGLHRTYVTDPPELRFDDQLVVRDGDVYVIPRGYHGPCVAAPGYTMYYLNVLAGPGGERSMAFCDDPAHHWVRASWETMPTDPRCPMTTAAGREVAA